MPRPPTNQSPEGVADPCRSHPPPPPDVIGPPGLAGSTPPYHVRTAGTLWRLTSFGTDRRTPGNPYWWENAQRRPVDTVVVQYTTQGSMVLRDASGDHEVPVGSAAVFIFGEDSVYGLTAAHRVPYGCEWLNLAGAGLVEHIDLLRLRHGPVFFVGEEGRQAMARLTAEAAPRLDADPAQSSCLVHGFVIGLITSLRDRLLRDYGPVEAAIDLMLRTPTAPWSLKQLAERCHCSREHLSRVFSDRMGEPPAAWLGRMRLEKALQLLRDTDLPVGTVAQQSGFASTHTLARHIRLVTGRSPRFLRG